MSPDCFPIPPGPYLFLFDQLLGSQLHPRSEKESSLHLWILFKRALFSRISRIP